MKHSKNHNHVSGFALMEVMLALFMVGSLLSALLVLQGTATTSIKHFSDRFNRIRLLRTYFIELELERAKGSDKTPPAPKDDKAWGTIRYASHKPQKGSALAAFTTIVIEQATIEWQEGLSKRTESLVQLRYKKPEQEQTA
jgi:Tfp pilus assembly protein PilV